MTKEELQGQIDNLIKENDRLSKMITFLVDDIAVCKEKLGPSGYRLMQELKTLRAEKLKESE